MKISFTKKQYLGFASVLLMLVIWQLLAMYFNSDFIMPSPGKTFMTVIRLFTDPDFVSVVGMTVLRGLVGFFISAVLGLVLGIIAGISPGFNAFLNPFLVTVRSVPVIAIILLALIWFSPGSVPVFIALLTMFPFICTNVIDGIRSVDRDIIEMARFYRISRRRIVSEVYIPAIIPFIISGASSAMGIGWRAIIIGEVLSQPKYGIGTMMQAQQTYLNVDAVIAWTIIAVLISFGFEKIIRWSEHKIVVWKS
ncbi:MAG TPA: ABC transporter permease [Bacteroidales bacterium]|nr:ABC transporter permease [Bacteroidales bacterium]HPM88991.1 ABC transporter permease [Bacteroidales bacterium]HQM70852.1 ABC transporter permease [Bacteroidales bacterium]